MSNIVVVHARRNHPRVNTPTRATSTKKTKASRSSPTARSSAPSSSPSWPPPSGSPRKCRKPALHRSLISFPRRVRLPFYSFYIHLIIPRRRRFIHASHARARRPCPRWRRQRRDDHTLRVPHRAVARQRAPRARTTPKRRRMPPKSASPSSPVARVSSAPTSRSPSRATRDARE